MRILDCFIYFNEVELLELRINLLQDYVDKFIIVDANRTHKGEHKEFSCKNKLIELNLLSDKIQIIELDLPSYEEEPNAWVRERMQRDVISNYIEDNDVCIISDCDEIINPDFIKYYCSVATSNPDNILRIPMVFLMNKASLRVYNSDKKPITFNSPFICMKSHIRDYTLSQIRESHSMNDKNIKYDDIFATQNGVIQEAGWHFSWMGDVDRLNTKVNSFLHWDEVKLVDNFIPLEGSLDCLGRENHILGSYDTDLLPSIVFSLKKVRDFLGLTKSISVIQIGANRSNDDLSKYLKQNFDELSIGIFVEPNSRFNNDIRECYNNFGNIFIENIAIVPKSYEQSEVSIFYHSGEEFSETASLKREHLIKHNDFYNHGEIKSFSVDSLYLVDLFNKYNIKKLDWLLLDIEGIDGDVILSFDWEKFDIKRVDFEYIHLGDKSSEVEELFINLGYEKIKSLSDFDWAFEKKITTDYYNDSDVESEFGFIDTNKFKINKNPDKRFFVVENFYQDPYSVRNLALESVFFEGEGAVGSRTRKQFLFEGVKEKFEEIMGKKILDHTPDGMGWRDIGINGRFQTCTSGTPLVYHCDAQKWAGMVYLTPDAPPQCGTTFFKHRKTGIRHNSEIDWSSGQGLEVFNQKTFLDGTPYEMVDKIGNVFNRLVIFDGSLIHSASEYFGWDLESSRLFHMFFFDTEN
jgi:FkbM family methyltransferase